MTENQLNTPDEIWKEVPGFEGYQVSTHGRVRSYRLTGKRTHKLANHPKILRPLWDRDGYIRVSLSKKGKQYYFRIHRLVLEGFVGPCPPEMVACHNDGKPANCHVDNLRWDTQSNNCLDRRKHGTTPRGEKVSCAKLTADKVKQIRELSTQSFTCKELGKMFSVCPQNISNITRRISWKHI